MSGYTLIDLVFALAVMVTLAGMAIPQTTATIERSRTLGAARYLATRLALTRTQAVTHAANVALVLIADGDTYTLAVYSDGNRDGVRTRDIAGGIDPVIDAPVRFSALFPRVSLFLSDPAEPPVPGAGAVMSFSPIGTASSRTLYVRGRDHSQYAVRVLGATGRTRLLRYVDATRQWVEVP